MSFLVVAYPQLHPDDRKMINSYREKHDPQYKIIDPHFTLVFPDQGIQPQMISEIPGLLRATNQKPIAFTLDNTISRKDDFSEKYFEFLIPSEGYNEIIRLHDLLYSNSLKACLRRNIEFIPHITIGVSENKKVSELRLTELPMIKITGHINHCTILHFDGARIFPVQQIEFR